jgi:hypothetical protein
VLLLLCHIPAASIFSGTSFLLTHFLKETSFKLNILFIFYFLLFSSMYFLELLQNYEAMYEHSSRMWARALDNPK